MGCLLQGAVVLRDVPRLYLAAPYVMVSALGRSPTEFGFYYLFIALGILRELVRQAVDATHDCTGWSSSACC